MIRPYKGTLFWVMCLVATLVGAESIITEQCKEKLFPVTVGGQKDELMSCVLHDEVHEQIIVVGNSTSENFVPAANDHGMIYAVDFDGNWRWGRFYYNVSFPLQTASACEVDANGALHVFGRLDDKPVILELNMENGFVNRFLHLEPILDEGQDAPWFRTFGGLHHEVSNYEGYPSYFYLTFIMDDKLEVMKFRDEPDDPEVSPGHHPVEWNYEYEYVFTTDEADTWKNKKSARFLHPDQRDPTSMFFLGRIYGRATIIKFNTRSFSRDWMLQVHDQLWTSNRDFSKTIPTDFLAASPIHDITSYVQPPGMDAIYACGYGFKDGASESVQKVATVFKMSTEGYLYFMKSWGSPLP